MTGAAAARALGCVGARFRLHGRSPDEGLDCIGLAAWAWGVDPPTGYALRGGSVTRIAAGLAVLGFAPGERVAGAIGLFASGPGQWHLGVWTDAGLVHADAGLRRVALRPDAPPWPTLGWWAREG